MRPNAQWNGPLPVGFFLDHWTTGVLAHSPYVGILLATPWILRAAREPRLLRRRLALLGLGAFLLPALTSFTFGSVAMRLEVDFVSLLQVPSLVLWALLPRTLPPGRKAREPLGVHATVAGAVGCALTLHGVAGGSNPGRSWPPTRQRRRARPAGRRRCAQERTTPRTPSERCAACWTPMVAS